VIQAIQRRLAARNNGDRQGGFTLIELMVVVMIIAILIGIAIPAFLGARGRAQDAAAKSNIRNALSSATAVFSDNQEYYDTGNATTAGTMVFALTQEEPSLTFAPDTTASASEKTISVRVTKTVAGGTNDKIYLAVKSKSNKCFFIRHVNTPTSATNTIAGSYQTSKTIGTGDTCSAAVADVPADADAGWKVL
jgi:type IV pilus assembly protein PilA